MRHTWDQAAQPSVEGNKSKSKINFGCEGLVFDEALGGRELVKKKVSAKRDLVELQRGN